MFSPNNQWNKLIRFDLIKENGLEFIKDLWYEDFDFNMKLALFAKKSIYVTLPLYHYVQRDGSIMHTVNSKINDVYKIIEDITAFYKNKNLYNSYYFDLEYLFIKEILLSSGKRFLEYDKLSGANLFEENYAYANQMFPNWKKNKYLKINNKVNFVLKLIYPFNYKLVMKLLIKFKLIG